MDYREEIINAMGNVCDKARQDGYNDGFIDGANWGNNPDSYKKGLNDAWECARKIFGMNRDTRMLALTFNEYENVFDNYSASEAIMKVKEYEEKSCEHCNHLSDRNFNHEECIIHNFTNWIPKQSINNK